MKIAFRFLIAAVAMASALASAAPEIKWKVLQDLDRFEPFEAQTFHAGVLWSARSRKDLSADYHLDVFDTDGKRIASETLTHSLRYLYPYDANSVLTVGVSVSDQLTHYTVATLRNGHVTLRSAQIPLGAFADEWAGNTKLSFFTDPGGLDEGEPIGQPLKTIFTMTGSRPRYLGARVRGPHQPVLVGQSLYVLENPSIGEGGKQLIRIPLDKETPQRVLAGNYFVAMKLASDGNLLIVDRNANEIVSFDVASQKATSRLRVASGSPRQVAEFGKCFAVAIEREKKVAFLNRSTGALVAEWDLNPVGKQLYGLRNIAADLKTGRVFVRSAYAANPADPGPAERNSVVMAEEPSGATLAACR